MKTKQMTQTEKEIERLVAKYPWTDSKDLFRMELEYLVLVAEREQMKADQESTTKVLKQK